MSKEFGRDGVSLLPSSSSSRESVSVVLIQDGMQLRDLSYSRVFALSDDASLRQSAPPFPSVSYRELLDMIFESDTVAVV